ncbi:hypothetical protein ERO13_D13G226251v2 [Gossypium hirsutum]|uniref:Uncharacterized protein n=2 Tax=Gossypium TaxID=3633 RepID=A0A5J5NUC7_GOSBA|nr:hypothetical protein ES319_D13G258200v1 [Gossypium barbadense]KAG4113488.1 hypothetical protein ERO13_D13G226251v2 [Gossypium hirsutum]TYJ50390.1 hypothetical protein E1A91_A01G203000v1 [Gossypium mustelinum]
MLSSPPLKSSQAFSSPVKSRSLGHRRWSRRHRRGFSQTTRICRPSGRRSQRRLNRHQK